LQDRQNSGALVSLPLHDRTFDLVLLSNWEDQIIYEPENTSITHAIIPENNLTTPANKALESGAWTQSIIWSPRAPFRDFTQLEFNHEDDVVPEERQTSKYQYFIFEPLYLTTTIPAETVRPRKRLRTDAAQPRDKFNLSNDHYYEVSKEGGRHRVRQTFGQLVVEHAYPAQKLQLPFVSLKCISTHSEPATHLLIV
jgi:transcription initiation factor TFIID subunit 1